MKSWTIALKDTLTRFRDRNAILLMLAAPIVIALIMGAAFGNQGDTSPISEIPVIIIGHDAGDLGQTFTGILADIEVPTAEGPRPLFIVTEMDEQAAALDKIEQGAARGIVVIPADFTERLQGDPAEGSGPARLQIYTDPASPVSPGILRGVVGRIASGFSTIVIGNRVAVDQLTTALTGIPVILTIEDTGPVAPALVAAFAPENFAGLLALTRQDDLAAARAQLAAGKAEAIIHVTEAFSQGVMQGMTGEQVTGTLEVIAAPGSLAAPLVNDLARQVARGFGRDANPAQPPDPPALLTNLSNLEEILQAENATFAETEGPRERITLSTFTVGGEQEFDLMGYFMPSMAIFFLMFAVFDGTRSILEEERDGTLHRLMTTPTSVAQILMGKIGGTFLTGILQFGVLVAVSGLAFGVSWGHSPVGLGLMVLATVAAATSLGAFVAAFARNNNQANILGTAITLVFAILGGNFVVTTAFPGWLTVLSKLTINRWALDGFVNLALWNQSLADVLPNVAVLAGIALVFFALAVLLFNRRFVK